MPIVPWKKNLNAWVLLAAVGSASALSLFPTHAAQAQSAPMQRTLPDFTDLVDQVGPSVVNIRTLEKVSSRPGAGSGMEGLRYAIDLTDSKSFWILSTVLLDSNHLRVAP